jgi:hypothetical protein
MYDNFCIIPGIERIGYPDRCSITTVALVLSIKRSERSLDPWDQDPCVGVTGSNWTNEDSMLHAYDIDRERRSTAVRVA